MALKNLFGNTVGKIGKAIGAPELGLSEKLGGNGIYGLQSASSNPLKPLTGDALAKYNGAVASNANGTVLDASTGPNLDANTAGSSTGDDPAQYNPILNDVRSKIAQAQSLYNSLYGGYTDAAAQKQADLATQFDTQQKTTDDAYSKGIGQLTQGYAAKGLSSSDYLTGALNDAKTDYTNTTNDIGQRRAASEAQIAQFLLGGRASIDNGRNSLSSINPNLVTTVSDALALQSQINGTLADANNQRVALTPNGQAIQQLNGITAGEAKAMTSLQTRLDAIAKSSAPGVVKDQIASGLISNNPDLSDDNKKKLLGYYQALAVPVAQPQAA